MEWNNAGGWLMDHNAPASFVGPASAAPDGPDFVPESSEDAEYDLYLDDWIRRVETGELDCMEAA